MPIDFASPGFEVKVISTQALRSATRGTSDPQTGGVLVLPKTDVTERIKSFVFEDEEKDQDILRLTVDNHDQFFFDNEVWTKGNLVSFTFGYPGRIFGPRVHVIESWKGFQTLKIQAVQELALLNKADTKTFKNKTIAQMVRKIVDDGTFFEIHNVVIDETEIKRILGGDDKPRDWTQNSLTDLQFLQYLAEQVNFEVYAEGDTLFFQPRGLSKQPRRTFDWLFGDGTLKNFDLTKVSTLDLPAQVEVCGYDPVERKEIRARGSDSTTTRPTQGSESPLNVKTGRVGQIAGKQVMASPETDNSRIKAEADARFIRAEQMQIEATATIIGDPFLPAKSNVVIRGISRMLSGLYYVTRHVHTIDDNGYEGKLTLLRNAVSQMPLAVPPENDRSKAEENQKTPPTDRRQTIVPREAGGFVQLGGGNVR